MEGADDIHGALNREVEATHLNLKESDISPQPDNYNVLESPALLISPENDWLQSLSSLRSPEMFRENSENKSMIRCSIPKVGIELPHASPFSMNDDKVMIEELMLKNYRSSNLSRFGFLNSIDNTPIRKGQWQHLYHLSGGGKDGGNVSSPKSGVEKILPCNQSNQDDSEIAGHLPNNNECTVSNNTITRFPGGIRTKVKPSSGFPQFCVRNTLKGKGVVYRHSETHERSAVGFRGQNIEKAACDFGLASRKSLSYGVKVDDRLLYGGANTFHEGICLREWLKPGCHKINKERSLHLFKQIVELVNVMHSRGVSLEGIHPSNFIILPSNQVRYVGSLGPQVQMEVSERVVSQDTHHLNHQLNRKRYSEQDMRGHNILPFKHQKFSERMKFVGEQAMFTARQRLRDGVVKEVDINSCKTQNSGFQCSEQNLDQEHMTQVKSGNLNLSNSTRQKLISKSVQLEERWYISPEELNDGVCTFSSNIYSLGVVLFELFCCFDSWEVHSEAMSDLRYRILHPKFLSEFPKEAGFCLWLLHPEPSSRPMTREILESELLCDARELSPGDPSSLSVEYGDAESELLLHFLSSLKEQKQKEASKLVEDIGCLKTDIEEVEKRHSLNGFLSGTHMDAITRNALKSFDDVSDKCLHKEALHSKAISRLSMSSITEARLMKNICQIENAYFSMRSKVELPETDAVARSDKDVLKNRDKYSLAQNDKDEQHPDQEPTDPLGAFFEGLCKYARYSKFEVRGTVRNGDLLSSANVICSLSFDRDGDYFAAAGVSKKIKIFEFGSLLYDNVDIHYPVIEMSSKAKLSCVCWNNYIKNYLASTDYDGVVQLWDVSTGQAFSQYAEHEKRAWSVDFSQVDPTKLASGSDDCSVKLWSINEESCIGNIRNVANVCCVQFSSYSTHLLAFGSADYKIYCYDLRNTRTPWCTLSGHEKAVSYVKFLDPNTLVSASTDNTLKLWDLNNTSSNGLSINACSLTFSGHTNEKNFVGLSVSDGYIACGSETNEVYAYYKSLPMPMTSHKFGTIDPLSGQETVDDNAQFVSSVCWSGKSNMIVAANSNGSIKLLQMV